MYPSISYIPQQQRNQLYDILAQFPEWRHSIYTMDTYDTIISVLRELPIHLRFIIYARYTMGMTLAAVAAHEHCSAPNIVARTNQALMHIIPRLTEEGVMR